MKNLYVAICAQHHRPELRGLFEATEQLRKVSLSPIGNRPLPRLCLREMTDAGEARRHCGLNGTELGGPH